MSDSGTSDDDITADDPPLTLAATLVDDPEDTRFAEADLALAPWNEIHDDATWRCLTSTLCVFGSALHIYVGNVRVFSERSGLEAVQNRDAIFISGKPVFKLRSSD